MKKIAIYLALVVVLSLSLVLPCFATVEVSGDTITWDGAVSGNPFSYTIDDESVLSWVEFVSPSVPTSDILESAVCSCTYSEADLSAGSTVSADYSVRGKNWTADPSGLAVYNGGILICSSPGALTDFPFTLSVPGVYFLRTLCSDVYEDFPISFTIPGFTFETVPEPETPAPTGIYWGIFDILHTHIYGGAELTSDMNLVLTMLSTTACLFCFAVPFMVVWWVIKRIS